MRKVGEPSNGPKMDVPYFSGPRFTLTDKELPDQKDWDPGESYHIEVEAKLISRSEGSAIYEMRKVGTEKDEEEDESEEEEGPDAGD